MTRARGFSLLEFAIVAMIITAVVYALIPRVSASLMLTHERAVQHTASAFESGLKLVALKVQASNRIGAIRDLAGIADGKLDLNAQGYPIGTDWQLNSTRALQAPDCEQIWYAVLGPLPPSAALVGDTDFRVQTVFEPDHGLGCRYRYRRGGEMHIHYFPDQGMLTADVRF